MKKSSKKIEVAVRLRPLIYEYEDVEAWCVNEEQKKITSLPRHPLRAQPPEDPPRKKSKVEMNNIYEFACDYVFRDTQSNAEVYARCCSRVVEEFLQGSHATIFMYGQTTSGKTYTMLGNRETEGLILFSLKEIFAKAGGQGQTGGLNISYLEIYNEQINDLLNQGSVNLKIIDEQVVGLSQCAVANIQEALDLLQEGEYQRAYAEKKYHDHSSRSHTIFQVKLMDGERTKAVLNLVDLSGSQRLSEEESNEETGYINKSLFTLSNVIHKLANSKKNSHIPFRDSKLTRLLAPSLTSSRNTLIICTISPAQINFSQTLSTLRFATQSRKIELRGLDESLNESLDVNRRKISQLLEENTLLKKNLSFAEGSQGGQCEQKFVENKIKRIEQLISSKQIKVASSYRRSEWRNKVQTLREQYQKNVAILQTEYFKALLNLSSGQLGLSRDSLRCLLEPPSQL